MEGNDRDESFSNVDHPDRRRDAGAGGDHGETRVHSGQGTVAGGREMQTPNPNPQTEVER